MSNFSDHPEILQNMNAARLKLVNLWLTTLKESDSDYWKWRVLGQAESFLAQWGITVNQKTIIKKGWFGRTKTVKQDYVDAVIDTLETILAKGEIEDVEVLLIRRMIQIETTLKDWLDVRMKDYTDGQYGKGEIRKLLESQ